MDTAMSEGVGSGRGSRAPFSARIIGRLTRPEDASSLFGRNLTWEDPAGTMVWAVDAPKGESRSGSHPCRNRVSSRHLVLVPPSIRKGPGKGRTTVREAIIFQTVKVWNMQVLHVYAYIHVLHVHATMHIMYASYVGVCVSQRPLKNTSIYKHIHVIHAYT
jgi:hypothetical protein